VRGARARGAPGQRQLGDQRGGGVRRVAAALRRVHHAGHLLRKHVVPDAVGGRQHHVARRDRHRAQLRGRGADSLPPSLLHILLVSSDLLCAKQHGVSQREPRRVAPCGSAVRGAAGQPSRRHAPHTARASPGACTSWGLREPTHTQGGVACWRARFHWQRVAEREGAHGRPGQRAAQGARRARGGGAGRGRASADEGVSEREPGEPSWKGQLNACCCCGERCTTVRPRSTQKPLSPRLAACSRPPSSIRMHTVAEPCAAARGALDRGASAGRGGRRRAAGPSLAHRARALRRPPWALAHAGTDVHVLRAGHWDPHVLPWERKPAHGAWGRPLERTGIRRRSNSAPSAVCVAPLRHMCLLLCHPAACCCAGRGTGLHRLAERTWRPPIGQGTEKMHIAPQLTICEHAPARGSCCARRA